jgi:hypothetical protein
MLCLLTEQITVLLQNRTGWLLSINSLYPCNLSVLDTPLFVKYSPISYAFMAAILHVILHDLTPLAIFGKVYKL